MSSGAKMFFCGKGIDRTIMSPFINWLPFYPQTSLEKLLRTAPPLTEIPLL
jgi:hypothetical protein